MVHMIIFQHCTFRITNNSTKIPGDKKKFSFSIISFMNDEREVCTSLVVVGAGGAGVLGAELCPGGAVVAGRAVHGRHRLIDTVEP